MKRPLPDRILATGSTLTLPSGTYTLEQWSPWLLAGAHAGVRYCWRWRLRVNPLDGAVCYTYAVKENAAHIGGGMGALRPGEDPYALCRHCAIHGHWHYLPFAQQPQQLGLPL